MLATIEGPMGAGKTATATAIAAIDFQNGRKIFSNYHLNFEYSSFDQDIFYRLNDANFELTNCTILADEGYLYMDNRTSMSKLNRAVHYYGMQTRKRGVDMYITTQEFQKIDKRIQAAVTMRIRCRFNPRVYMNTDGKPWKNQGDKVLFILNEETQKYEPKIISPAIITMLIRRLDQAGPPRVKRYNAENIFPLYNTNEMVEIPANLVKL